MNSNYLFISLLILALTTYLIRVIPLGFFHRKIENLWVKDFLYYIPFCVLSAMTFPDVFYSTTPPGETTPHFISGIIATQVALILSWKEKGLCIVALMSVLSAILVEYLLKIL